MVSFKTKTRIRNFIKRNFNFNCNRFINSNFTLSKNFFYQIVQSLIAVLIVGIGSGFYLTANLGPGPRDGLMTGLQKLTTNQLH